MYRIGEFSKMSKTTIKTLRFYDEIGLFKPNKVDDNGYRYYQIEQMEDLEKIIKLKFLGIPLDKIQSVLAGINENDILKSRKSEIENELKDKKLQLTLIKKSILDLSKGVSMNQYEAKIINMPERVVYYRQGVIKGFENITDFITEANVEVRKNNPALQLAFPVYCYVSYLEDHYTDTNIAIEYAEAVMSVGKESKNIKFKKIESKQAVSVFHKGSYENLRHAYAFAVKWVEENGYVINDNIRERYIDGAWNKEKEEDFLTEIQIPVISKK